MSITSPDGVLVIGGTGLVGQHVVHQLIARGVRPRVTTRRPDAASRLPAGASAFIGDIVTDPYGFQAAFEGIDAVFMVNATSTQETTEGLLAIELARRAGVRRFVFQSIHRLEELAHLPHVGPKLLIEQAIARSGMESVSLRANHFFQGDEAYREMLMTHGLYGEPFGPIGCSRVDVGDIGEAAAITLIGDGHAGEIYNLVGPRTLTGPQCAEIWAEALGRPITYAGSPDAWEARVGQFVAPWIALDVAEMYRRFAIEGMVGSQQDVDRLAGLLGRRPHSFEDYASDRAQAWLADSV